MGVLTLLGIVGCLALVLAWYVVNEDASSDGDKGLFALREDAATVSPEVEEQKILYREKRRGRPVSTRATLGEVPHEDDFRHKTKSNLPTHRQKARGLKRAEGDAEDETPKPRYRMRADVRDGAES